jgi:hypothetical protein
MQLKKLKNMKHTQIRAMERYGVYLSTEDLDGLMNRIHAGDADYIGMGDFGTNTSIWCIEHESQKLYPLIHFEEKYILTFLTKAMTYRTVKTNKKLAQKRKLMYS